MSAHTGIYRGDNASGGDTEGGDEVEAEVKVYYKEKKKECTKREILDISVTTS